MDVYFLESGIFRQKERDKLFFGFQFQNIISSKLGKDLNSKFVEFKPVQWIFRNIQNELRT